MMHKIKNKFLLFFKDHRKKIVNTLIYVLIASIIIPSAVLVYMLFRPYNAIRYTGQSQSLSQTVESGGVMNFRGAHYCNDGYPVSVTRFIENEVGSIQLLSLSFNNPDGPFCVSDTPFRVEVPSDVPPGTWRLKVVTAYKPNATFRTIKVDAYSNWFQVVEAK